MAFFLPFRAQVWWPHIVPPLLAVAFFALGTAPELTPVDAGLKGLRFLASLVGTAAFGYFLNDWADIGPDRRAGKRNFAAKSPFWLRPFFAAALLGLGGLPWLWLWRSGPLAGWALVFWILLVACLVAYSVPPLRLKNRAIGGVLCDMAYGHLLPSLLTLALFSPVPQWERPSLWAGLFFFVFLLKIKGLRNILLHQVQDRSNDRRNGENTFVVKYGASTAALLLNRLMLPLELLLLLAIGVVMAHWAPIFLWTLLAYLTLQWLVQLAWIDIHARWRRLYGKFWYLLNDFYEGWLLYAAAFFWCQNQNVPYWAMAVVFLLFPNPVFKFLRDVRAIGRNFRDMRGYLFSFWGQRLKWWD